MQRSWIVRVALVVVGGVGAGLPPVPVQAGGDPGGGTGSGITVEVEPATGLVDYQLVQATATGFEPFSLHEIFECRADAVDESGCDADNAGFAEADAAGEVHLGFVVDARIYDAAGNEHDCRSTTDGCTVGVGLLAEFENSGFATLDFDPAAPLAPVPTMTVSPATGLVDQQVVQVTGADVSSLFETFVYQCIAGRVRAADSCNFDQDVRAVAGDDGTVAVAYRVDAALHPANGDEAFDCTTAPGACVLELSQGFSDSPDRFTRAPISFATGSPPTTAPTTPPTSPPVAPPARPIPRQPTFTG
jgi:hypothetical protein